MRCTKGTSQARLTVLPSRTVWLTGQPMANISDHLTMVNLAPFGRCRSLGFPATASATAAHHGHLTPMPCMHNTPFPWQHGKDDYIVKGDCALLKSSTCPCLWGGTISLVTDGQKDTGAADLSHKQTEEFEKDQPKKNGMDVESVLDGIQMALDVAGFAPGVGAIPDLTNAAISALRGNWLEAGMSLVAAVPGIGDAAAAGKLVKNGMKIAKGAKARKEVKALDNVVDIAKGKEIRKAKNEKLINDSDNVVRGKFPSAKANSNTNAIKGKGDNVARMDRYERKVEKVSGGNDKVTIKKKTETVVDSKIERPSATQHNYLFIQPQSGVSPNRSVGHTYERSQESIKQENESLLDFKKTKKEDGDKRAIQTSTENNDNGHDGHKLNIII